MSDSKCENNDCEEGFVHDDDLGGCSCHENPPCSWCVDLLPCPECNPDSEDYLSNKKGSSVFLLPFDTESTGIPYWKERSDFKKQPHIVQLAALLVDENTRDIVDSMDVIVKPDGWEISQETIDIHGITMEKAMDVGIPEVEALEMFLELWKRCHLRIAHNTTFDNRMIRIALKRYMPDFMPDEVWKDRELYYCTLNNAKKIMGGKSGHTLDKAYKYFTGKDLEGAHNAMVDVKACMAVYFGIQDLDKAVA